MSFLTLLLIEARYSVRKYPDVNRWTVIGTGFFIMVLVVGSIVPLLIPVQWLRQRSIFDVSDWGYWSVPVSIFVTTFFGYWVHRAMHRFNVLWRITHQLHHSARRVDLMGAYFSHPLEIVVKVSLATSVNAFILSSPTITIAIASTFTAVTSLFQHVNIRTPRWLGFFVQRPESHCLHHEYEIHGRNYGDLPFWDILFGTFQNPEVFNGKVGLDLKSELSLKDLLLMRTWIK
jgi:sterol desaturase/sphingolipid hydroxylase (fatty acid hydroxylase superfamily)